MAKRKYADLDPRGRPVNEGAYRHTRLRPVTIKVPDVTWSRFKDHAISMKMTPAALMQELINGTLSALGEELEAGLPDDWYSHKDTAARHVHQVPAILVAIDEVDFPTADDVGAIEDLDPYKCSALLDRDLPEYQVETKQMRKIERELEKCATNIAELHVMKRWTSVYAKSPITKDEAREKLRNLLDVLPADITAALWGWCDLDDAIYVMEKYVELLKKRMTHQLELHDLRMCLEERLQFEEEIQCNIDQQRAWILGHVGRRRSNRVVHGGQWPTWAEDVESYVQIATQKDPRYTAPRQLDRISMREYRAREAEIHGQPCTIEIVKELDTGEVKLNTITLSTPKRRPSHEDD